jgi:hypothetical protein
MLRLSIDQNRGQREIGRLQQLFDQLPAQFAAQRRAPVQLDPLAQVVAQRRRRHLVAADAPGEFVVERRELGDLVLVNGHAENAVLPASSAFE